jgi:hypothetical protein
MMLIGAKIVIPNLSNFAILDTLAFAASQQRLMERMGASKSLTAANAGYAYSRTCPTLSILWENVRDLGVVLWILNDAVFRSVVLTLAQNEFINSDKNPESCALFYAMLGKKSILADLYRKNPVHSRIYDLLSTNFGEERWKSAAIKNALVLMSKNRLLS